MKNKKKPEKKLAANSDSEKLAKYASAPFFKERDKKAAEFLQKHSIPSKFLK